MNAKLHFISGMPRSGTTLLAGILRQNPAFHAAMSGPVAPMLQALLTTFAPQSETAIFVDTDARRAVLKRIEETPKGPRLILSRADPLFVKALFRLEVPEIMQNVVEIRATAREAGSRTKIAVISRDDGIDPVGACVGLNGSRVQAVVNELGGERIDIVPWSPDPERFAKLALAPARVARVFSDPATKTIQAIVDEVRASLAMEYLRDTRLPLGAIAERLGFSDTSNFSRAFRSWFGRSPGSCRPPPV